MTIAVVAIDLQYHFFGLSDGTIRATKAFCLPGVRRLLHCAREKAWKVVHVVTEHADQRTLPVHLVRRGAAPYCIAGSPGCELVDGLFQQGDLKVRKCSYSGYLEADLMWHLDGSEVVLICGVAADCCVLLTAFDAATRFKKRVFLPFEAVSSADRLGYVAGLRSIAKSAGAVLSIDVVRSAEPEAWWERRLRLENIEAAVGNWFDGQQARVREMLDSHGGRFGGDIRAAVADLEARLQ